MKNFKFSTTYLYENTNKGLDIILKYVPAADGCENGKKAFKFRPYENSASAYLKEKTDAYVIVDYGDISYQPINVCMFFTGLSFLEALKLCYADFNLGETANYIKPNTTFKDTDKPLHWFEIIENKNFANIDVIGRFVTEKIALEYDFISVEQYSFTFVNKKTNLNTICTVVATENYPIYAYYWGDTFAKIYQPLEPKTYIDKNGKTRAGRKHSFVGKKPERHIYGLTRLKSIFDDEIKHLTEKINEANGNEIGNITEFSVTDATTNSSTKSVEMLMKERNDFKIDSVFICTGGSDGLNVASLGFNAIWLNSEGEQINYAEYKQLQKICKTIYNLPDIDTAGKKYAYGLAETFWNLPTVWLPKSISQSKGKDFRDWLKKHSKSDKELITYQFNNLISAALRMKFFDKTVAKRTGNVNVKLRTEFLFYFLNIKGFYTYKVQRKAIDKETTDEIVLYIKVEGNVVTKVSPRIIRQFCKDFAREKGQSIEVLELLATSTLLNDNTLIGLPAIDLNFKNFGYDHQMFVFENNVVKITSDKIELLPHSDKLGVYVWDDAVKPHTILPEAPFFALTETETKENSIDILRTDCEYLNFLINTCRVHWRYEIEEQFSDADDRKKYVEENRFKIDASILSEEQILEQKQHLLAKIFGLGYLMHRYKQDSYALIFVITDYILKHRDEEANGGTAKSLIFKGLNAMLGNRFWLDGKNKNLENDRHALQGLTKEADYWIIEDLHENFNIKYLYTNVTESTIVNPKNSSPYEIKFEDSPKMAATTNYGIKNYDGSTKRRLNIATNSDFYHAHTSNYNEQRKVCDDFEGKDLFANWTPKQWNRHYYFLLQCCQFYIKNRNKSFDTKNNVEANNATASIGDVMCEWADAYFYDDFIDEETNEIVEGNFNKNIPRSVLFDSYKKSAGSYAKNSTNFKTHFQMWCNLQNDKKPRYELNPKDILGLDKHGKQKDRITQRIKGAPTTDAAVEHFFIRKVEIDKPDGFTPKPETAKITDIEPDLTF